MSDDVLTRAGVAVLGHLELPGEDQLQAGRNLADARDGFADTIHSRLTEAGKPREFLIGQPRKHLSRPCRNRSSGRVRHLVALTVIVQQRNESAMRHRLSMPMLMSAFHPLRTFDLKGTFDG